MKRRTRGIRLLPLKPDGAYHSFLEQLWPYQLTPSSAPLTEKMANKLYDHSAGIPAYIRPLAKLGTAVNIADASNQRKAKSETASAVAVAFREDTKPFDKADSVFHKDTLL